MNVYDTSMKLPRFSSDIHFGFPNLTCPTFPEDVKSPKITQNHAKTRPPVAFQWLPVKLETATPSSHR